MDISPIISSFHSHPELSQSSVASTSSPISSSSSNRRYIPSYSTSHLLSPSLGVKILPSFQAVLKAQQAIYQSKTTNPAIQNKILTTNNKNKYKLKSSSIYQYDSNNSSKSRGNISRRLPSDHVDNKYFISGSKRVINDLNSLADRKTNSYDNESNVKDDNINDISSEQINYFPSITSFNSNVNKIFLQTNYSKLESKFKSYANSNISTDSSIRSPSLSTSPSSSAHISLSPLIISPTNSHFSSPVPSPISSPTSLSSSKSSNKLEYRPPSAPSKTKKEKRNSLISNFSGRPTSSSFSPVSASASTALPLSLSSSLLTSSDRTSVNSTLPSNLSLQTKQSTIHSPSHLNHSHPHIHTTTDPDPAPLPASAFVPAVVVFRNDKTGLFQVNARTEFLPFSSSTNQSQPLNSILNSNQPKLLDIKAQESNLINKPINTNITKHASTRTENELKIISSSSASLSSPMNGNSISQHSSAKTNKITESLVAQHYYRSNPNPSVIQSYLSSDINDKEETEQVGNEEILSASVTSTSTATSTTSTSITSDEFLLDIGISEEANPRWRPTMEDGHVIELGLGSEASFCPPSITTSSKCKREKETKRKLNQYSKIRCGKIQGMTDENMRKEKKVSESLSIPLYEEFSNNDYNIVDDYHDGSQHSEANKRKDRFRNDAENQKENKKDDDKEVKKIDGEEIKVHNENVVMNYNYNNANNSSNDDNRLVGYFGVYDGHGGRDTVDYLVVHLHKYFSLQLSRGFNPLHAFHSSFLFIDQSISHLSPYQYTGATVAAAFIRWKPNQQRKERELFVSNVGDARVVIAIQMNDNINSCAGNENNNLTRPSSSLQFKAVRLTRDHCPTTPREISRVISSGGRVSAGRVCGQLAVSRAIGDHSLKKYGVSAIPTQSHLTLTKDHKYLIIACDGLFDVLNDQECVDLVQGMNNAQKMSEKLVRVAMWRGTTDNISVMVIRLST